MQQLNQPDDLGVKKQLETMHGKELVRQLADLDPAKIRKQCEDLLEKVGQKYGDVKMGDTTLGKLVEPELFEIRRLAIGKTVPDVSGEDLDGKGFNLSDYRGKVVVMVFWGTWCPPCRAMLPHEKELVKKMENKPFALIGMNSDMDKDALKTFLEKKRSPGGRSPREAPPARSPPSGTSQSWPTIYVVARRALVSVDVDFPQKSSQSEELKQAKTSR